MTSTEGLDKTLHGAKAAAGVGGALAAVSTAARVTVGNTRAMVNPEKAACYRPTQVGRPKGSRIRLKGRINCSRSCKGRITFSTADC